MQTIIRSIRRLLKRLKKTIAKIIGMFNPEPGGDFLFRYKFPSGVMI